MQLKKFFSLIVFAVIANTVQATAITAPSVDIQGGSKVNAVWRAPLNHLYKVWVFIPKSATTTQAIYRFYPKGKNPDSTLCSAIDYSYPCIDIGVNQALSKNQWIQLKVNNNADTSWDFIGGKGYITVSSRELSKTENLGIAGIRFEEVEPIAYIWQKALANVSALKLAMAECLNDTLGSAPPLGEPNLCATLDTTTGLGKYGIIALPDVDDASGTSIVTLTTYLDVGGKTYPAIQIAGDSHLGGCTFQLQMSVNTQSLISFQPKATAAVNGNVAECVKYVKNSTY